MKHTPRAGGATPIYFLYSDVPTVTVSFSGSSVLNRVYNFTFSCLKQGRPHQSSPFLPLRSHDSFANFVRLRWDAWKRKLMCRFSVLNTALSLRQGSKIYIFCVLNRIRVSLSRPNPPTQIPVEYTPREQTPEHPEVLHVRVIALSQNALRGSWPQDSDIPNEAESLMVWEKTNVENIQTYLNLLWVAAESPRRFLAVQPLGRLRTNHRTKKPGNGTEGPGLKSVRFLFSFLVDWYHILEVQ